MSQPCPPPERWKEHLDGTLSAAEQAVLNKHLDHCAVCRRTRRDGRGCREWLLALALWGEEPLEQHRHPEAGEINCTLGCQLAG